MQIVTLQEFLDNNKIHYEIIIGKTKESTFFIKSDQVCTNCLRKRWLSSFYKDEISFESGNDMFTIANKDYLKNAKNKFIELKNIKTGDEQVVHEFLCVPNCAKWEITN